MPTSLEHGFDLLSIQLRVKGLGGLSSRHMGVQGSLTSGQTCWAHLIALLACAGVVLLSLHGLGFRGSGFCSLIAAGTQLHGLEIPSTRQGLVIATITANFLDLRADVPAVLY